MKKAVYSVMVITVAAKILGFGREILLSYYFGASGISDAYLISQTIPGTIFLFVGTGLATSFIPVYMKIKNQNGIREADSFTNTILTLILVFSTIVVLMTWLFTKPLVKLFANGFVGQTLDYAAMFTRIGILSLYFSAMTYVFNSYLQANGFFSIVAFVAIPNSIVIMLAIVFGAKGHVILLAIGSLLAVFIQLLILWWAVNKQGFRVKLNCDFFDSHVKEIVRLMIPVILGVSVNQINVLIDRTIASRIATGGISALMYADSLIMFVQGVFSQSVSTVYYPSITKLVEEKKENEVKTLVNDALGSMAFILVPIMMGCIILGIGIVRILYGRGEFSEDAVNMTGQALSLYGVGIVGYGFRETLSRVFYAYHDTKTPMLNATIGMVLNIILNIILSELMGIGGLALATSVSSITTAYVLYIHLKKSMGEILDIKMKKDLFKMIVAASVMGVAVWLSYINVERWGGNFVGVMVSVFAGMTVYFILTKVFRVSIYEKMKEMIKSQISK